MSFLNEFIKIFHDNFNFVAFSICAKLNHDQSFRDVPFIRNVNLLSVIKRSMSASCGEFLSNHRIVNDSDFRNFVHKQRDGDRRVRETVDEVHRAVDWVDDPRWSIRQLNLFALTRLFLADELMIREFAMNPIHQKLLYLLVGFGDKIRRMRFYLDSFPL